MHEFSAPSCYQFIKLPQKQKDPAEFFHRVIGFSFYQVKDVYRYARFLTIEAKRILNMKILVAGAGRVMPLRMRVI